MSSHVFAKLEAKSKEKIPGNLEKIISSAGYETEGALATIDGKAITEIENFINENKFFLKETAYEYCIENNSVFKFKPGHRSIILSIPKLLSCNTIKNKKSKNVVSVEEKENLSVEELTKSIITKVVKFAGDRNFLLNTDSLKVIDLREEDNKIKCNLQCPICHKQIRCQYIRYWIVSNFEAHLKLHFARDVVVVDYSKEHSEEIDKILSD